MALFKDLVPFRSAVPANRAEGEEERYIVPAYDLKEAHDAYGLEVDLPGVAKDDVNLEVEQDQLVITARRKWTAPKDWKEVFRETPAAHYRLRLDLNESVNVDGINAELCNGVLRVTLPKAEAIKPRRIEIG
ncbi:MAG: Hsp20/alpha crystallin family protein [Verrucomicrobia bacterium]|nr:MAG: Hsp20/alpha crystallin family protein [Verrucomicrobiota bacterium]